VVAAKGIGTTRAALRRAVKHHPQRVATFRRKQDAHFDWNFNSLLARTLLWLRDRAITGSAEGASIDQLNRFVETAGLPQAAKRFQAVSVVCESLVKAELAAAPAKASPDYTLVVIAVPDLKDTYTAVFGAAKNAVLPATTTTPVGNVI
jgi:hypothetical protein